MDYQVGRTRLDVLEVVSSFRKARHPHGNESESGSLVCIAIVA